MRHGKKSNRLTLYSKMILLGAVLVLFAYGCAGPKENIVLNNAKAAYEKAKGDPNVQANAPVPLYEAGQTLKSAEIATSDAETNHLAYMAEKQTAIAVTTAEQKLAEAERQKLAKDKDQVLLEQRERQARTASGEAADAQKQAEAAQAQAKKLEQELAELKAKKTDRGFVLTLGDVLFATGKADLMSGAQRTIDQLAGFLNKYPAQRVIVEGHTDSVGSEDYNVALSQRRAGSVRSAIMARGISSDRISAKGLGELYPVASNDTPAGRQQNRRVEILIPPGE